MLRKEFNDGQVLSSGLANARTRCLSSLSRFNQALYDTDEGPSVHNNQRAISQKTVKWREMCYSQLSSFCVVAADDNFLLGLSTYTVHVHNMT